MSVTMISTVKIFTGSVTGEETSFQTPFIVVFKSPMDFVMFVHPVRLSVSPHASARFPVDCFLRNSVLGTYMKNLPRIPHLVKIG